MLNTIRLLLRGPVPSAMQPTLRRNTSSNLPKRGLGGPAHAPSRNLDLSVQLIDLLKRQALRFIDHEIHKSNAQKAACEPDEEDLGLQVSVAGAVVHEVGRCVGNGPV